MKRANTIARIRTVRRAISTLALACFFVAVLHSNEPVRAEVMQDKHERQNRSQTIAFLPPNKEVKIVKK